MGSFVPGESGEQGPSAAGLLKGVLDAVAGQVWLIGPDLRILQVNRSTPNRDAAQFVGMAALDFVVENQRQLAIDSMRQVLDGSAALELEFRSAMVDRWFRVRLSGIRHRGQVTGIVAHLLDVDDFKSLTQERDLLRSSQRPRHPSAPLDAQRRLELMADALPLLVSYIDRDHRYQYNNAAYAHWFGTSQEALRGRAMEDVLGRPAYERIRTYVEAALGGQTVSFEATVPYRNAGTRRVVAHYVPDVSDGATVGFYALVQDITTERRAEEAVRQREDELRQMQKLEALGHLAGSMAHEFNNVLQTIRNTSALVLALIGDRNPDVSQNVALIDRTVERGSALARELLQFGGTKPGASRALDLDELLSDMKLLLEHTCRAGVAFQWDLHSPCLVTAEAGQIQQVVLNLAINAQDAMPDGGTLTISSRRVDVTATDAARHVTVQPGPYAQLAVADSGIGMDEETLGRIFEPFYTTKPPDLGTGLGLSTVYRIVRDLHGFIEVESSPGQGSRFQVYLPCNPCNPRNVDAGDADPARERAPDADNAYTAGDPSSGW